MVTKNKKRINDKLKYDKLKRSIKKGTESSLLFFIFLAAYEFRIKRDRHLLRLSTNRPVFWYLHMKKTCVRIVCHRTSNQTGQYQESTADGIGLSIQHFQVYFDGLCDMKSSIVTLKNYFVVYLLVLWPFFFQCSAQTHQLKSIPYNSFVRLKQLVVHNPTDSTKYRA